MMRGKIFFEGLNLTFYNSHPHFFSFFLFLLEPQRLSPLFHGRASSSDLSESQLGKQRAESTQWTGRARQDRALKQKVVTCHSLAQGLDLSVLVKSSLSGPLSEAGPGCIPLGKMLLLPVTHFFISKTRMVLKVLCED